MRPRYSTQAAAAEDGRDLADMEEGLKGEDHAPSEANDKLSDMKTISLSQVDAPTLAEFEVSIQPLHGPFHLKYQILASYTARLPSWLCSPGRMGAGLGHNGECAAC